MIVKSKIVVKDNAKHYKAVMTILSKYKITLKTKSIMKYKERNFKMSKGSFN